MYQNDLESSLTNRYVPVNEVDKFIDEYGGGNLVLHSVKEGKSIINKLVKVIKSNIDVIKKQDKDINKSNNTVEVYRREINDC